MNYILNLLPRFGTEQIINCSQYDTALRRITFSLYYGQNPYPIPYGSVLEIRGTKKDRTIFSIPVTFDGNEVVWELSNQVTLFPGIVNCQLRITNNNALIGTANFKLQIQASSVIDDPVLSESQIPLIEAALQNAVRAEAAAQQAESAQEQAKHALENISLSVEETETGARITASDMEHTTTAEVFNGQDGTDGFSPEVQVIDHGDGTYTLTITDATGTSSVDFRAGTDGDSLVATSEPTEGGIRVIIKNARTQEVETSFVLLNGSQGATGADGNGISSAILNQDYTLTLNFTDGTHYTTPSIRGATGATGNGIASITKTSTSGLVDTYTITFTDGTTTTFNITNGQDGTDGQDGEDGNGISSVVLNADYTLTLNFTDGTSYTTPNSIRGETGATGATGNGIASAVLNADYTLTLNFTDGTSYTTPNSIRGETGATGATGNGIASITKTGTSGLIDTYTITFTDSTTTTFQVTNGQDGTDGDDYILTSQDKDDIADLVYAMLTNASGQSF